MFIPTLDLAQKVVDAYGTPIYLTDTQVIKDKANMMKKAFANLNLKIFYAIKANFNPHIIKIIKESGIYGVDAVSLNEVRLALELGYEVKQIIFTPSNPSNEDILYVGKLGILQNLGSISEVERFGKFFPGQEISIRICPEIGAGESRKVATGNKESKFGVSMEDIDTIKKVCKRCNLQIVGIHSHIGSGFYDPKIFKKSVEAVCNIAKGFECIKFLDFGGGYGVQYDPNEYPIDLSDFSTAIETTINEFTESYGREVELRIEPGKFLVSQSTVLITKITTIKEKSGIIFIGVDSGLHNLIRPAMYGTYHNIINVSRKSSIKKTVQVVGNVCESGDVFNEKIEIDDPQEGDILVILTAGGYGSSMSSNYNLHEFIPEVFVVDGKIKLTKIRQTFEQIMHNFINYK